MLAGKIAVVVVTDIMMILVLCRVSSAVCLEPQLMALNENENEIEVEEKEWLYRRNRIRHVRGNRTKHKISRNNTLCHRHRLDCCHLILPVF